MKKKYIVVTKQPSTVRETDSVVPLGDIIDRLSILQLSVENGIINETDENLVAYVNLFDADCRLHVCRKQELLARIKRINKRMWTLESILRNPGSRPLEMIGRTALLLRDINKKRIAIRQNVDTEVRAVRQSSGGSGNEVVTSFEETSNQALNSDCQFRFAPLATG